MSSHGRPDANGPRVLIQSGASYIASIDNRITIQVGSSRTLPKYYRLIIGKSGGVYHVEHHYPAGYQGLLAVNSETATQNTLNRAVVQDHEVDLVARTAEAASKHMYSMRADAKNSLRVESVPRPIVATSERPAVFTGDSITKICTGALEKEPEDTEEGCCVSNDHVAQKEQASQAQESSHVDMTKGGLGTSQKQTSQEGSECAIAAEHEQPLRKKSTRARCALNDAINVISIDSLSQDLTDMKVVKRGRSQKARVKKEIIE